MIKGIDSVGIFSENPKILADFYKDKVGLNLTIEVELGEGEDLFGFEFGQGSTLYITKHEAVKGKNSKPERIILNLEVDNIEEDAKRLDGLSVKKIQEVYHVEGYGLIATYEDPDGNYFQLVQVKPS